MFVNWVANDGGNETKRKRGRRVISLLKPIRSAMAGWPIFPNEGIYGIKRCRRRKESSLISDNRMLWGGNNRMFLICAVPVPLQRV
jgi:hypothetical protein